jgi:hypothetical protein
MPGTLTALQAERFARLAETVADTRIPHYEFSIAGAAAGIPDDDRTPAALQAAMSAAMDDFYTGLLRREGEYSETLAVDEALSVAAAVFGALCGNPALEPGVAACDPGTIVDILAGNWSLVDGCDAEDWVAGALSPRCAAAAALFRTHVDDDGKWHRFPRDAAIHDRLRQTSPPPRKDRKGQAPS